MKIRIGLIICITLIMQTTHADVYHYKNILIGERASGFGSAYTAVADDASGLFYNPAGIVFSEDRKLSASVNAFHNSTTTYKGVLGGKDWVRESSALLPNFFGVTKIFGEFYTGFSYVVTDSIIENQDSIFTNVAGLSNYIINVNNQDTTTLMGPSIAFAVSDELYLGLTLYFHQRTKELISNQWSTTQASNESLWINSYYESSESGLQPVFGLMWIPADGLTLGVSARKTVMLDSTTTIQTSCSSDFVLTAPCNSVLNGATAPQITEQNDKRDLPLNVVIGVAYSLNEQMLVAADFSYNAASDDAFADREATTNFAVGGEYAHDENWVFRVGMFSNNANTSKIVSGQTDQLDHVDQTGFSFSLSRYAEDMSITAGFTAISGSGQAQVIPGSTNIQNVEQSSLSFFLSNTSNF